MKFELVLDLKPFADGLKSAIVMTDSAADQMSKLMRGEQIVPDYSVIESELAKLESKYGKLGEETDKVDDKIKNTGKKTPGLKKAISGFKKFKSVVSSVTGQFAKMELATQYLMRIYRAAVRVMEPFANLEENLDKLQAVSGATADEMARLTDQAKELGKLPAFTATQVAALQIEYAKLGFTAQEIVAATSDTLNLSKVAQSTLADSATVAGTTLKGMRMAATETGRVVDVMALSFSTSALDMEKWRETMKTVGPVSAAAGYNIEQTTTLMAKLADQGINGSIAGMGLKNILSQLADDSSKLNKLFKGEVKTFDDLVVKLKELKDGHFDLADAAEYTDMRSRTAFLALVNAAYELEDYKIALDDAAGSAKKMADIMTDNVKGAAKGFTSAMEGAAIELGQVLEPALLSIIGVGTDFFNFFTDSGGKIKESFEEAKVALDDFYGVEKNVNSLIADYEVLTRKASLSKDEQVKLNGTIKSLEEIAPGATDRINEYGDAISINTGYVLDFIAAEKARLRLQYKQANEDMLQRFSDVSVYHSYFTKMQLENTNNSIENLNKQKRVIHDLKNEYANYYHSVIKGYGSVEKAPDSVIKKLRSLDKEYKLANQSYNNMIIDNNELTEEYKNKISDYQTELDELILTLSGTGIDFEAGSATIAKQMGLDLEKDIALIQYMERLYINLTSVKEKKPDDPDDPDGGIDPAKQAEILADLEAIRQAYDLRAIDDAYERQAKELFLEKEKIQKTTKGLEEGSELWLQIEHQYVKDVEALYVQRDEDKVAARKAELEAEIDLLSKKKELGVASYAEIRQVMIEYRDFCKEVYGAESQEYINALANMRAANLQWGKDNKITYSGMMESITGISAEYQQKISSLYSSINSQLSGIFSLQYANLRSERDKDTAHVEESEATKLRAIEARAEREGWTEERLTKAKDKIESDYIKKKEKINKGYEAKEKALKKRQQKLSVAEATINTATSVMKTWAHWGGWPLGVVPAGIMAALGGYQVKLIAAQKYAMGGPILGGEQFIKVNEKGEEYIFDDISTRVYGVPMLNFMKKYPEKVKPLLSGLPKLPTSSSNQPQYAYASGGSTANAGTNLSGILQRIEGIEKGIHQTVKAIQIMNLNMVNQGINTSKPVNIIVETSDPEARIRKDLEIKEKFERHDGVY
jgi:TP901 family phage tail tape measure protein